MKQIRAILFILVGILFLLVVIYWRGFLSMLAPAGEWDVNASFSEL